MFSSDWFLFLFWVSQIGHIWLGNIPKKFHVTMEVLRIQCKRYALPSDPENNWYSISRHTHTNSNAVICSWLCHLWYPIPQGTIGIRIRSGETTRSSWGSPVIRYVHWLKVKAEQMPLKTTIFHRVFRLVLEGLYLYSQNVCRFPLIAMFMGSSREVQCISENLKHDLRKTQDSKRNIYNIYYVS